MYEGGGVRTFRVSPEGLTVGGCFEGVVKYRPVCRMNFEGYLQDWSLQAGDTLHVL